MFNIKPKAFSVLLTLVIISSILTILLAACGSSDSPTPLPTPTTAPSPTPLPSPTPAPTAAAASPVTTTLAITNTTQVPIDNSLVQTLAKNLPGVNNPVADLYVSDDSAATLANNADATLVAQGYTFAIPGSAKPTQLGGAYIGVYSKTGSPDVVIAAADIPSNPANLAQQFNFPGITPDLVQKYADQLKGKKSALVVISGPGLLQALFSALASGAAGSTGSTDTPAATPTSGS